MGEAFLAGQAIRQKGNQMLRQIRRNIMKREIGSNRIQHSWLNMQIKRLGYIEWFKKRVACDPRKRQAATLSLLYCKA
jgi:hypothetical protein